jgi:Ca2+-binding RTX toxin-like protein
MPIPTFGTQFNIAAAAGNQYWGHVTALANGSFAAAWHDAVTLTTMVRVFSSTGAPIGNQTALIGTSGGSFSSIDIQALSDGRFVVAYEDTALNAGDIRVQVFGMNGTPFGASFSGNGSSTAGTQSAPTIAALRDGNFAIGYTNANAAPDDINFYRFGPDGSVLNGQGQANFANSADDVLGTAVTLDDGRNLWFYISSEGGANTLRATGVSADTFSWVTVEATVSDGGSAPLIQPSSPPRAVLLADGNVAVVWQDQSGEINGRIVRIVGINVTMVSDIFSIAASANAVSGLTALIDGGFVVGFDAGGAAFVRQHNSDGTPVDTAQALPGIGDGGVDLTTLADGRILATYFDDSAGNFNQVAQMYDPRLVGLNGSASSFADDWHGTGFSDNVYMGLANDVFHGAAGNDYVYGEGGIDTLFGGDGADYVKGGNSDDVIWGADGLGALTDIGDVWLAGEAGNDTIHGEAGNDRIDGGDGLDTLYGDAGLDYITAGNGIDTIYGGDETGAGDAWLGGDAGDDAIYGGDGNDRISGDAGMDTLYGGLGNDYATGGSDNDTIYGGNEAVGGDAYLAGDAGIDTIYGEDGNDRIDGGTEGDFLYGGLGQDTITGAAGDDYILGGAGTDGLYGGAGIDIFDYNVGSGTDNIYDFANDIDKIYIDPAFGLTVALVLTATSVFGNHAYINLNGGDGIIILNWFSAGYTIPQLANDILVA